MKALWQAIETNRKTPPRQALSAHTTQCCLPKRINADAPSVSLATCGLDTELGPIRGQPSWFRLVMIFNFPDPKPRILITPVYPSEAHPFGPIFREDLPTDRPEVLPKYGAWATALGTTIFEIVIFETNPGRSAWGQRELAILLQCERWPHTHDGRLGGHFQGSPEEALPAHLHHVVGQRTRFGPHAVLDL